MEPKSIIVLGGVVMDLVFQVPELPDWTQAVQASKFQLIPGGKGLNQAVAASKLGADVRIISAVGDDEFGRRILGTLEEFGVVTDFVDKIAGAPTAATNVLVNYKGEAAFVGWKGIIKEKVDRNSVLRAEAAIEAADAILITLEVSFEAVEAAIRIARDSNTIIILNPAPPLDPPEALPHTLLQDVNVVVPNAWEAVQLLRAADVASSPEELAKRLNAMGVKIACVTTSESGCVVAEDGSVKHYPTYLSNPIDTTGASDAFCASLALAMAEGRTLDDALVNANAAGALVVGGFGGSTSMPSQDQISRFLRHRKNLKRA